MDDKEPAAIVIDPNLCCKVCGEKDFSRREGFFYCNECGTKQDQVRQIEGELEDEKHAKKQKIHKVKTDETRKIYKLQLKCEFVKR